MDPLHATRDEFVAEGFTHVECHCPRCRVTRLRPISCGSLSVFFTNVRNQGISLMGKRDGVIATAKGEIVDAAEDAKGVAGRALGGAVAGAILGGLGSAAQA
jgi:hypothetical protein